MKKIILLLGLVLISCSKDEMEEAFAALDGNLYGKVVTDVGGGSMDSYDVFSIEVSENGTPRIKYYSGNYEPSLGWYAESYEYFNLWDAEEIGFEKIWDGEGIRFYDKYYVYCDRVDNYGIGEFKTRSESDIFKQDGYLKGAVKVDSNIYCEGYTYQNRYKINYVHYFINLDPTQGYILFANPEGEVIDRFPLITLADATEAFQTKSRNNSPSISPLKKIKNIMNERIAELKGVLPFYDFYSDRFIPGK